MKISYTYITTVFLGICVIVSSEEECDLECEPGYTCTLRLGDCAYPPCPWFPTCHPVHGHHQQLITDRQRHESRQTSRHQRHQRNQTSILDTLRKHVTWSRGVHYVAGVSSETPTTYSQASERPGQCPVLNGPCITTCRSDGDCTDDKKCCDTGCGQTCRSAVEDIIEKPGTCPRHMDIFSSTCTRECHSDLDCGGVRKCCGTGCGTRCTAPCFYWIHPNQRSGRKSFLWKLPFVCRT